MPELDKHMVVIDADLSRFKRNVADATEDAKRRFRDVAREATAAFAPASQMRGRSILEKFGTGAPSPINKNKIEILLPSSVGKSFSDQIASALAGEQAGSLLSAGITVASVASLITEAAKLSGRFVPVVGAGLFGLDLMGAGLPQPKTSTLKDVLDQINKDVPRLEDIKNLLPRGRERGGDRFTKEAERLKRNINDAVVGLEEALKNSAQGIQTLRRQNEDEIPNSLIGRANVDEFRALADALGEISEVVKDPKLQQQIENVLKRQEFIFRTGRELGRGVPDGLGRPLPGDRISAGSDFLGRALPDERIDPRPLKSSFLDLGGGVGLGGLDRGLADAGARVADLSAGFMELTQAASGFEAQGGSLVELLVRSNALFGAQSGLLGQLTAQAPVLGGELAALFEQGAEAGRVFGQVADALGASLLDAFEGAIARGESLSDVLKGLALDLARLAAERGADARRSAPAVPPPAPANAEAPVLAIAA